MDFLEQQVTALTKALPRIDPSNVLEIEGHNFLTFGTLLLCVKALYQLDFMMLPNGNLNIYLSIKGEYSNLGFATSYNTTVEYVTFERLELKSQEYKESTMLYLGLADFEEIQYLEILYIKAVERCQQVA